MTNIHKSIYRYDYCRSSDQDSAAVVRRPVVVVGAGPVGLSTAIDLALHDVPVVLIDDADRIGEGSRGICWSKRTLEILDRLGIGERLVAQGVTWKLGKVFRGDDLLFSFDLLPEEGHKMPAFINLQQYYLEKALVDRALELRHLELRWKARLTGVDRLNDGVRLTIDTPDGPYRLDADWLIAADGARSSARRLLGLDFAGVTFEDKFLIADVHMAAEFPTERRFWFTPTFHSGQSALMHRQPDDVWRVDLQLGSEADPVVEQEPKRVRARLDKVLKDHPYELEWVSVYTFNCRRLDRFVHDRVIFIGDAAHQVSPFGARGANSGIQDAENLAWKLAAVLKGEGGGTLIESYDVERVQAADDNIGHSTRSTDFMSPHSVPERRLRDAVLALAPRAEFARRMINSGRLSLPAVYATPLSTPDVAPFAGTAKLGAPLPDAPLARADGSATHFVENLRGCFELIHVKNGAADEAAPRALEGIALTIIGEDFFDRDGKFAERLDATPGATYLVRPDQHLCARWRSFDAAAIARAHQRALAR
jgi:3-(3-hydroxy-phenyl)propionate hydroxylase